MAESKALVVLSGGQDSVTCLGWALHKYDHVACVTFNYGQRHARELEAAAKVVDYFGKYYAKLIPHEIVDLPAGVLQGTSPLTNSAEPLETYTDHDSMAAIIGDRVEKTFVPMRNTLFLTLAANRAVVAGIGILVTGVCQEDNANYPDCTKVFVQYTEECFNESLGRGGAEYSREDRLRIVTPLISLSKAETVRLAMDTPATYGALAFSHTAYDGAYPPAGRDHASLLRAQGFLEADRPDPLVLRAVYEGRMPMPESPNYREAASFADCLKGDWT